MLVISLAAAAALLAALACGIVLERWRTRTSSVIANATRRIVECMPAQGWSNDPDGNFTYVNPSLVEYFGLDGAFFNLKKAGTADFDADYRQMERILVHPDDLDACAESWRRCLATGDPFRSEHRCRGADGTYRWFRVLAVPARDPGGKIVGWHGIGIDIEEQRRAEAALSQRERELQQLIDTVPALIWRAAPDGEGKYMNRGLEEFAGLRLDDFPTGPDRFHLTNRALIHPDDLAEAEAGLAAALASGEPFTGHHRMRRADGIYRWVEHRARPLCDSEGTIREWYGVCVDIDDLKQTEAALRHREGELKAIVDTIPAMIFALPSAEGPLFLSRSYLDFTGYVVEDHLTPGGTDPVRALQALMHPDDLPEARRTFYRHLEAGTPRIDRYRIRRRDGAFRWVEVRCASLASGGRYGVMIDVDDEVHSQRALREAQERLARATQAAGLSELSASIAHEINQPLAAVIANAQACRNWLAADPPNLARAEYTASRVIADANSAADVIARIRALFRRHPTMHADEAMDTIVAETCALLADEAAVHGVPLVNDVGTGLPRLRVDRVQIQQVLVNLVRNAIDATVPARTAIVVRARLEDADLILEVCDEGSGIVDPEQAFEPFVTTKTRGMGMGLAVCRSIVEAHGGRLAAGPNLPRGTTVSVVLPIRSSGESSGAAPVLGERR